LIFLKPVVGHMVVYDLICAQGHRFEGWFENLKDLSAQLAGHLLVCPVCGNAQVSRRPSTFGVVKAGREERDERVEEKPAESSPPAPVSALHLVKKWAEFSRHLEREFDDVGQNFAEEALKMHYGVTKRRGIRGLSTETQEAMLRKEGIDFFKVPLLARKNHPSTN
jgi:hypothetical protein